MMMSVTINLPADLEVLLRRTASAQERSAEDVAIEILRAALLEEQEPTLDEVVARIRSTPPNPAVIRPAQGSLAEALAETKNADFDLATWQAAWSQVEEEMAAITQADERADRQRH
jgi:plasmid stability protein